MSKANRDSVTAYAESVTSGAKAACKWERLACERHLRDLEAGAFYFDATAAERAIRFFSDLRHYKGQHAGQSFTLHPAQQFIVGSVYGWKTKKGGPRRFRYAYIEIPRKNGKALALDTPIPTPDGWTTMGELKEGDVIFSESGSRCIVEHATEVMHNRPCYLVTFSNGESVVADADHLWLTSARVNAPGCSTRKGMRQKRGESLTKRVRTTEEIARTLTFGMRHDTNHSIDMPAPLQLPDANLPVEPYLLGAWLGDGHSAAALLCCGDDDVAHFLGCFNSDSHSATSFRRKTAWSIQLRAVRDGVAATKHCDFNLKKTLRRIGVLNNKHIPEAYFRASYRQRLALLQGLMDTDGTICKRGNQLQFVSTKKQLADGVMELLATLGLKAKRIVKFARCQNGNGSLAHSITFTAFSDMPVFRLPRKLARMLPPHQGQMLTRKRISSARSRTVQIVSVDPVPSVPVRCISVSSPSKLYLFGKTMLPTHNTTLSGGVGIMGILEEPGAEVYSVATKEDQAKIGWRDGRAMIKGSPGLSDMLTLRIREIRFDKRESVWKPLGADSETLDGLNPSLALMDELHAWPNRDLWDVIDDGMGARLQPLIFQITTAGSNRHGICAEQRKHTCGVLDGTTPDEHYFGIIFTIDEGDDPHDPRTWAKANPLLGIAKTVEFMQQQSDMAKLLPGKLNAFLNKQLNVWTEQEVRWLSVGAWDACAGEVSEEMVSGAQAIGALDMAATTDVAAFVRYFRMGDGRPDVVLCNFWVPEDSIRERSRKDRVPYDLWAREGLITPTPGNVVDYDKVRADILAMHERTPFSQIVYDPWNTTQLATQLQGDGIAVAAFRQGFASMSPAAKELEKRLLGKSFAHGGNPVLRWMAGNAAIETDAAGNIKPSKRRSSERIDGIVALTMAIGCDMRSGAAASPEISFL